MLQNITYYLSILGYNLKYSLKYLFKPKYKVEQKGVSMDYIYNFENKKKKTGKKVFIIVILVIAIIIFASFLFKDSNSVVISKISNVVIYPFEKVYDFGNSIVSGINTYFANKKKLVSENETLQNEVNTLKIKLIESQKILDENTTLRQMLEIKKAYQHFNVKMAKIIYREHDNWTHTFKIDIGQNDGIKKNQAVIHVDGLVGYISKVESETSTVTTILDPSSSVSVSISTINEPAILKGDLDLKASNKLILDFIPLDAEISIDDMLYTSGLGSTYPASLPVGKITEIVKSKNDMNRYAIVSPNVNIRTISEVGVIVE